MSNILVTGAEGQLGQCFHTVSKEYPSHNLFFVNKKALDITKTESLEKFFFQHPFEGIINCAAYSKVDQAEVEIDNANAINKNGIQNLATFAEQKDLFIIHFSTDYVFDGKMKVLLKEEYPTNPLNQYAKSKLEGEAVLRKTNCIHTTFRISWLFSPFGDNFVKTILKLTDSMQEIHVVKDQIGRPTYGIDLARMIMTKLNHPEFFDFDCYHFANEGTTSWFDFARKIIDFSNSNCNVKPCLSSEHKALAVRPFYSILDTTRIERTLSLKIRNWETALRDCVNKIQYNEII